MVSLTILCVQSPLSFFLTTLDSRVFFTFLCSTQKPRRFSALSRLLLLSQYHKTTALMYAHRSLPPLLPPLPLAQHLPLQMVCSLLGKVSTPRDRPLIFSCSPRSVLFSIPSFKELLESTIIYSNHVPCGPLKGRCHLLWLGVSLGAVGLAPDSITSCYSGNLCARLILSIDFHAHGFPFPDAARDLVLSSPVPFSCFPHVSIRVLGVSAFFRLCFLADPDLAEFTAPLALRDGGSRHLWQNHTAHL